MKHFDKNDVITAYICLAALVITTAIGFGWGNSAAKSKEKTANENGVRYEYMERFGNIDSDGTLFIAEDGNLYAVDAQYPNAQGNAFLLKMDGHGTPEKTDDEILEVWACPSADWATDLNP